MGFPSVSRDSALHAVTSFTSRVFDAGSMGCADGLAQEFRTRLADINVGDSIAVIVSDPAAKEDLPSLARLLGHSVRSVETKDDNRLVITVEKRK